MFGSNDPFADEQVIFVYSRKDALRDGIQVNANIGDFSEVTRQHYKIPVYMTGGVFDLIDTAVKNPRYANDFKGVWHDILTMSRVGMRKADSVHYFRVIIRGAGRVQYHAMKIECQAMDFDDPQPALTISLEGED